MALTVSFNGTNVNNADTTTDWDAITITAPEAWTVEVVHQGLASIGFQASSKDGMGLYESLTSYNFNTTYLGQHIFMWVNCTMPGTMEALATGGLYLVVGSSQSDYKKYLIAAKDYKEVMEKGFARFVFDPSKTATETIGTPDMTAITVFGVWIDTDEAARIDQLFIDRIDVGYGLTVTGTSTDFWNELAIADIGLNAGVRDNMYGICQYYNGVYFIYGQIKIGDDSGTLSTAISDSGKTIKFVSQEYYNGTAWVDLISDSFFKIDVVDNATGSTQVTDGVAVGTDAGRSGSSITGSTLHDTAFNSNALTNSSSFVKLYSTKLTDMRAGIPFHNNSGSLFYGGSVVASGQFAPGAAVVRNMVIAETTDLDASVLWNESINVQKTSFIANTLGAAIEHPSAVGTPYGYTNLTFSGNTNDVYNSSGSAITINLTDSDASSYEGTTVTFVNSVNLNITGIELNSKVYIYDTNGTVGDQTDDTLLTSTGTTSLVSDGEGKYKFVYSYNAGVLNGTTTTIKILNTSYEVLRLSHTLDSTGGTIPVQQRYDRNYNNPS